MRLINLKEPNNFEVESVKICVDFLLKNKDNLSLGRNDIPNSNIYANIAEYDSKLLEESVWEAHKKYIDLQIVLEGAEKIMVSNIRNMDLGEYSPEKDFLGCFGEAEHTIEMNSTVGLLLMPEDAHMPGVALNNKPAKVRKCVFKIPVEE